MTLDDNVFDSRDAEQRIEELWEEMEDDTRLDLLEELEMLLEFKQDAIDSYGEDEWDAGITFVADHHFTEYAEQLARDVGFINGDTEGWPFTHINWAEAAEALQYDYSQVNLGDDIYWGRD